MPDLGSLLSKGMTREKLFPDANSYAADFISNISPGKASKTFVRFSSICDHRGPKFKGIPQLILLAGLYGISGEHIVSDPIFQAKLEDLCNYISNDLQFEDSTEKKKMTDEERFAKLVKEEASDDPMSSFLGNHVSDNQGPSSDEMDEFLRILKKLADDEEKADNQSSPS